MADEQTPTQPSFVEKLQLDAKTLWNEHRLFFIVFGVLIVIVKFRDVLIDILISSAKNVEDKAKKQDATLAAQEDDAKKQADALVDKAKHEGDNQPPVDDDWYKKK